MRKLGALFLFSVLSILLVFPATAAGPQWQGAIPQHARDQKPWADLIEYLLKNQYSYGAMAASQRILMLFTDLPSKELAYRTIVELIDRGYPFSSLAPFLPGDIDPAPMDTPTGPKKDGFYNSYYLYKSFLNRDKNAQKWADAYLAKVDQENFPKYRLHMALDAYQRGKMEEAEVGLKETLAREYELKDLPFVRKTARTLARIYFEQENYEKSLDVYMSFLLRLNPVAPSDWLEAAWSLYHLRRYAEAIGMIYNMESRATGKSVNLEKYIIRALSYRELCDIPASEALIQTFEGDFGAAIKGIKRGEPLSKFAELAHVELPENSRFRQVSQIIEELEGEQKRIRALPVDQQAIAGYLYDSELEIQRRAQRMLSERALSHAAQQLIMMAERLRFLKFDVAREKFNPDQIFRPTEDRQRSYIEDVPGDAFVLRWPQLGDYWRDERLIYQGAVKSRCGE